METTSILRDLLVLIGILPVEKPTPINQEKKRMGYPGRYFIHFSKSERDIMHLESDKLAQLFN